MTFSGKRILVTGGTGSLGQALVRRLLANAAEPPATVTVFSRDEAKQHYMRLAFLQRKTATDEIIYKNSQDALRFRIGDIREAASVIDAVRDADIVIHAAALKQVPSCEYFPDQAVHTNILGATNLIQAIRRHGQHVEAVVGISTDKACKPINVMGMTKALMERLLLEANIGSSKTRFACVRYGNVIASRGSVVPLFRDQIDRGGPVTITLREMNRFLLSLDQAVDTVIEAAHHARPGETYIPKVPAARVVDLANAMMSDRSVPIEFTGIRPGEKVHEIMISEEERFRTLARGDYFVIQAILPELRGPEVEPALPGEYSSEVVTLDTDGLRALLAAHSASNLQSSLKA